MATGQKLWRKVTWRDVIELVVVLALIPILGVGGFLGSIFVTGFIAAALGVHVSVPTAALIAVVPAGLLMASVPLVCRYYWRRQRMSNAAKVGSS